MTSNKMAPWNIVAKDTIKIDSNVYKVVDLATMVDPIIESFNTLVRSIEMPELVNIGMENSIELLPTEFKQIVEAMRKAISDIYMKERLKLVQEYMKNQ